jgi:glycosyltransferase involved in cell wall biosynthesis
VPTLTVIVIAKNEEAMIGRCLRSVDFADARIVVDSGSTDRTVDIASACGARVVSTMDWPGFGAQKNRALAFAETDWVLSLDADEWLDASAAAEVRRVIERAEADAFELPRRSRFCGRVVRHCGWSPDYVCRLFRRGAARFSDDLVHERLIVKGVVRRLRQPIDHDSIESWADAEDKIARYAYAAAQQMAARGRRASRFNALLHGWGAFVKTLVLRAGVLDGATGWQVAEYNRRYAEAKWRRLAELTRAAKP